MPNAKTSHQMVKSNQIRGPRGEWNAESVPLGGGGISLFGELGIGTRGKEVAHTTKQQPKDSTHSF